MSNTPPVCLTIAGLDPSGGAGIIADIRTFGAFGCFPTAVVTSLTFQNTHGVFGSVSQDAESVRGQLVPIFDDYEVAAIKTGMLPTREVITEVASVIESLTRVPLVVDPVVRSTSGYDLIDDEALAAVIEHLFPLALLVTPNLAETERITGVRPDSPDQIRAAAEAMRALGARGVLIKGGHSMEPTSGRQATAVDYLYRDDEMHSFSEEFIESNSTHGTGCVLSAAITANLARGKSIGDAIAAAKSFVTKGIRNAPKLGKGHSPVGVGVSGQV